MAAPVIKLELPPINGNFAVGLSATSELGVEAEDRLPVYLHKGADQVVDPEESIKKTLLLLSFTKNVGRMPDVQKEFLFKATYVAIAAGAICTCGGLPDGDFYMVTKDFDEAAEELNGAPVTSSEIEAHSTQITDFLKKGSLTAAGTILVATKVNWFKENHHVGQGTFKSPGGTFVKKAIRMSYSEAESSHIWTLAHRVGHYASTRAILTALGITGIKAVSEAIPGARCTTLKATDDMQTRIRSAPAGTARYHLASMTWKAMVRSIVFKYCPQSTDDIDLLTDVENALTLIKASPAKFHRGSLYLTGRESEHDDSKADCLLGRGGTYVAVFMKDSSLAKSPHISGSNYQNFQDYDPDYYSTCNSVRMAITNRAIKFEGLGDVTSYAVQIDRLNRLPGYKVNAVVAKALAEQDEGGAVTGESDVE